MHTLISLILLAAAAELFRRFCMAFIKACTGPLSKVPGPFLNKFTLLPWLYQCITGNMVNIAPGYFEKYGNIVRVGPNELIVADKAAIRKIVVEDDLPKSPLYESIRMEHDISSLFTETDKVLYKQKRRLLSPGFSISYINGLEPLVQGCIDVLVKVLNARCKEGNGSAIVDMPRIMGNVTSDVMSATSFGGSFNLVETDDSYMKDAFLKRMRRATLDSTLPFLKYLPFMPPSRAADMDVMIDAIIDKRRNENAEKGTKQKDLVQIFVDTHESDPAEFTRRHIREEMMLFMIAGSDTSSVSVTHLILLLLNNPEKYCRLIEEIDEAFPSVTEPITFAKTQELPYLNAVINESMRVMPVLMSGVARITSEPTVLCNYEIPAETSLAAYVSRMMVDPQIWPDAKTFIPERWLEPYKGVEADRKAFMPFSAGSRNCIGQQFALKEIRLIVATLVRKFEMSLVPGQSHELRVFITPQFLQGYYNVGMKPRA